MKERPIIFSTQMVRSILAGRKTQTRRVVKNDLLQNYPGTFDGMSGFFGKCGYKGIVGNDFYMRTKNLRRRYKAAPECWHWVLVVHDEKRTDHVIQIRCPYGAVGDELWVRETWRIVGWQEGEPYYLQYKSDGTFLDEPGDSSDYDEDKYLQYYIDCSDDCEKAGLKLDSDECYSFKKSESPTRWRPSIFMPRWASRIQLRVTDISVERVQDITKDDIYAEGTETDEFLDLQEHAECVAPEGSHLPTIENEFQWMWNGINQKRGYGWEKNPWVWAVQFKVKE